MNSIKESIIMFDLLSFQFMQFALLGGAMIALCCGLIGPFVVLRRLSLIGDGLAHLAFGGIALGLLINVDPLLAALVTTIIGSFVVQYLVKRNVYGDAAIALILSFGVGIGITIIGVVRGFNTGLYSYLIGSLLALSIVDLAIAGVLLVFTVLVLALFYQDLFQLTFNEELALLARPRAKLASFVLTILIAMVVVVSIRAVGILLVSALLVIPTLIALVIAKSFRQTLVFSSLAALIALVVGIATSFWLDIPPSGAIVLLLLAGYVIVHGFKTR